MRWYVKYVRVFEKDMKGYVGIESDMNKMTNENYKWFGMSR